MESCPRRTFTKVKPVRDLDVYYDKILSLPLDRDYHKEVVKAKNAMLSYVVQPCFDTMFSDCRARYRLVARQPYNLPQTSEVISAHGEPMQTVDLKKAVAGANRSVYFNQPRKKPKVTCTTTAENTQLVASSYETAIATGKLVPVLPPQHKMTQSDYRESETQTDPWTHDVVATGKVRLLQLGWLRVDPSHLLSQKDIALLERHWHKQAWDELMPRFSLLKKSERRIITQGLAANDTAARDVVLEKENKIRISLSAQQMSGRNNRERDELNLRLHRFNDYLRTNRMGVVGYLRRNLERGFRRLASHYKEKVCEERFSGSPKFKSQNFPTSAENDELSAQTTNAADSYYQIKELEMIERLTMTSKYLDDSKMSSYQERRRGSCQRPKKREERRIEKFAEKMQYASRASHHKRQDVCMETPGIEEEDSDLINEGRIHCSVLQRLIRGRASQIKQEAQSLAQETSH